MSRPQPLPAATGAGPLQLGHFIGGRMVAGSSGRTGTVYNPATGAVRVSITSMRRR